MLTVSVLAKVKLYLIPPLKNSPTFVLFGLNFWARRQAILHFIIIIFFASVVVFSLALLKISLVGAL